MQKQYSNSRMNLMKNWGPECILRCCRDWKSHTMLNYAPGSCGVCGRKPEMVLVDWDGDTHGPL
jgi:hypothetical protein